MLRVGTSKKAAKCSPVKSACSDANNSRGGLGGSREVLTDVLEASERNEETQHIVGAFENAEDTQVAENLLHTSVAHEAHSSEYLK